MKWQTAWQLIKDILLTGTGLAVIVLQIWSPKPSDVLLVVGLALTVPSAASHAASILSRAWSTAVLGVIGAAWGAGVTTLILIFAGVIR